MGSNKINQTPAPYKKKSGGWERRIDGVLLPQPLNPTNPINFNDLLALIADQSVLPGERSAL